MAPGVFYKWWKICATQLKPLRHNGFSFDGLITPTLKVAGSNPVGRTTSPRTTYRSRRLFYRSHLSLILSRLLSKPDLLSLGSGLGPPLRGGFFWSREDIDFNRPFQMALTKKIPSRNAARKCGISALLRRKEMKNRKKPNNRPSNLVSRNCTPGRCADGNFSADVFRTFRLATP